MLRDIIFDFHLIQIDVESMLRETYRCSYWLYYMRSYLCRNKLTDPHHPWIQRLLIYLLHPSWYPGIGFMKR